MAQALDKISQHFQCDICQDRYKQPKILDCVHSFCQKCLEDYYTSRYKDAPKIPCPVCRQETVLPDTRIQGLKTNFHLMGIMEEVSKEEKAARSGNGTKCQKHPGEEKWFYWLPVFPQILFRFCLGKGLHRRINTSHKYAINMRYFGLN